MGNSSAVPGYVFAVAATAIWSVNFIIARGLVESIPPVSLAFWRWFVAVLVFLPFALKTLLNERNIVKENIIYICITAFLGITVFNTLIYVAGHSTAAINLSLIAISFPMFIVILSRFISGELITGNKVMGVILIVIGIIFLISKGSVSQLLDLSFAIGDVWMLLAAFIFAVYSILLKYKTEELSIWSLQLSTFIAGLIFLFPLFVWEYVTGPACHVDAEVVGSILYVGIFSSFAAFVLWNKAVEIIGPTKAGMVYYTLPLFCMILAVLFLEETVTGFHFISALLIISGIFIANFEKTSASTSGC